MLKKAVVQGLMDGGYSKFDAENHWLYTFKPLALAERAQVLESLINPTTDPSEDTQDGMNLKENSNMTSDNNSTTIETTQNFSHPTIADDVCLEWDAEVITYDGNDGKTHEMFSADSTLNVSICGATGKAMKIAYPSMARRAINALGDYIYFHDKMVSGYSNYLYLGLHSKYSIDELVKSGYEERMAIITHRFNGADHGIFLSAGNKAVGFVNKDTSGRKFIVTQARLHNNSEKNKAAIDKHNFVDAILEGRVLEISLKGIHPNWVRAVIATFENPDRDDAWKKYQAAKDTAGKTAEQVKAGKEVIRANKTSSAPRTIIEGEMKDRPAPEMPKTIQVQINNGSINTVDLSELAHGMYQPVNATGKASGAPFQYTGAGWQEARLVGLARKGLTLTATR